MTRIRVALLVLYVLLIFFVSSRPYLQSPGPSFKLKDKVAHVAEYSVLGMLLYWGIGFTASRSRLVTFLFLVAVGAAVAGLDEIFQSLIPGRRTDLYDWVADAIGLALGVGILVLTARRGKLRGEAR
jgi:VanZ family protein